MCSVEMLASEHFYGIKSPSGFLPDYAPTIKHLYRVPLLNTVKLTLKNAKRSCLRDAKEKSKKKVVFADDRGLALEHIKFMSEPTHLPPIWAFKIVTSPPVERKNNEDLWEENFESPAVDYVEFRRRITEDCVSLDKTVLRQYEGALDGTIKVKNLDFYKEVFVRTSSDGWSSYEDTFCSFLESGPFLDGQSLYDTFSFRLQLPVNSRRMDFCVCFSCKGCEYWDSNKGLNYVVERSSVRLDQKESCARINTGNSWNFNVNTGTTPYW